MEVTHQTSLCTIAYNEDMGLWTTNPNGLSGTGNSNTWGGSRALMCTRWENYSTTTGGGGGGGSADLSGLEAIGLIGLWIFIVMAIATIFKKFS